MFEVMNQFLFENIMDNFHALYPLCLTNQTRNTQWYICVGSAGTGLLSISYDLVVHYVSLLFNKRGDVREDIMILTNATSALTKSEDIVFSIKKR